MGVVWLPSPVSTATCNNMIGVRPISCLGVVGNNNNNNNQFFFSGKTNLNLLLNNNTKPSSLNIVTAASKNKNNNNNNNNNKKKKEDNHSHVARPDEATGPFPEAVLLKQKQVQEDGTLLPEFADDEEQDLFELFSLQLESGLEVDQMRHYEVVYLIHEDREEEVESVNTKVEEFIKEKKGKIWRFSDWGLRRLAYKIQKARNAHYILMNFEIAANWVNDFKTMLDKDERVIRHLVMKKDKAETEYCPPPPLFSSSYAVTDDDEDDDFDFDEDEDEDENGDDNEEGIVYVDDFIENDSQKGKLETQKAGL